MPIPKPQNDENKNEFISRCIEQLKREDPNSPDNIILAICYNQWENK